MTAAVSKKTAFVVAGEDAGGKLLKARQLGVRRDGRNRVLPPVPTKAVKSPPPGTVFGARGWQLRFGCTSAF